MQIEHKTDKGTLLFVKVPDDAAAFNRLKFELNYIKFYKERLFYVLLIEAIKDNEWQLIGLTSEVTEEQWRMMIPSQKYFVQGFSDEVFDDLFDEEIEHNSAKDCAKSLMQHLHIYEVNPHENYYFGTHGEWMDKQYKIQQAQSRTGKWLILFKEKV